MAFFGHTHVPGIFVQGGGEVLLSEEGIKIPVDKKVFINAGSIGQPRDGDWRAAYMIHDEEEGGLWLRRLEYDVEGAREAVINAGLPEKLANRLFQGN
jgi:predicted phosphodiesterase